MAKKKTSAQVIKDLTCPSCGLLNQPINQHCSACGYMWHLSEDEQPKKAENVETNND